MLLRFTMKPTPTVVMLLVMTRVAGVNTRQLSCSKAKSFIATEGKVLLTSVVREAAREKGCRGGQVKDGREGKIEDTE